METQNLVWKKERPQFYGHYFRTTLWGKVLFEYVDNINGKLCCFTETGEAIPVENYNDQFYWLGPIPKPPEDANWLSRVNGR